jgi:hypothetical protein
MTIADYFAIGGNGDIRRNPSRLVAGESQLTSLGQTPDPGIKHVIRLLKVMSDGGSSP